MLGLSCNPHQVSYAAWPVTLVALAGNKARSLDYQQRMKEGPRLALPHGAKHWSLTTLREKLIKIGAKVVTHARYVIFQMAEVAVQDHGAPR